MRLVGILLLTKNLGGEPHTTSSHYILIHFDTFCVGEVNLFVNSGLGTQAHNRLDSPNMMNM